MAEDVSSVGGVIETYTKTQFPKEISEVVFFSLRDYTLVTTVSLTSSLVRAYVSLSLHFSKLENILYYYLYILEH